MKPNARKEELVIQVVGDETIVYDERRNHAHRLNRTAAMVWQHCDGEHTVADLQAALQQNTDALVTEEIVWLALGRLEKEQLLAEPLARPADAPRLTRRDVLRKAVLAGGLTLMLPVVQSMAAPTPAMAMSSGCAKRGQMSSPFQPCCPGLRASSTGVCVGRTGQS